MKRAINALLICWLIAPGQSAEANPALGHRTQRNRSSCTDPALVRAAAELGTDRVPTGHEIREATVRAGSDATAVHAVIANSDRLKESFLQDLKWRSDAPIVCGEATNGGKRLVLATTRAGSLSEPPGDARHLVFTVRAKFQNAYVAFVDATGELHRYTIANEQNHGRITIPPDFQRPGVAQLVATGPFGPRPIAQRILAAKPTSTAKPAVAYTHEQRFADIRTAPELVRALRHEPRRAPLRLNRLLSREAQRHAQRICAEGRIVHTLGDGDPEQRLRTRGLVARAVGEVVARGDSWRDALLALAESPSHRLALTNRQFTDAGFGRARVDRHYCVVIMLAAWPRTTPVWARSTR